MTEMNPRLNEEYVNGLSQALQLANSTNQDLVTMVNRKDALIKKLENDLTLALELVSAKNKRIVELKRLLREQG